MDKFLCVMAGYDDATERYFSGIQNELYQKGFVGTHTKELPQHITLGSFPCTAEAAAALQVKAAMAEAAPFEITFSHIGLFGEAKVLFIAPDINRELLVLKEHFGGSQDWTPHTTMLIDEPEVVFSALPLVAARFRAFSGRVERLHLYEFWPTRHILSVELGG